MDLLQNTHELFWTPREILSDPTEAPALPSLSAHFPTFCRAEGLRLKLSGWRLAPVPPGPPETVGRQGMPRDPGSVWV